MVEEATTTPAPPEEDQESHERVILETRMPKVSEFALTKLNQALGTVTDNAKKIKQTMEEQFAKSSQETQTRAEKLKQNLNGKLSGVRASVMDFGGKVLRMGRDSIAKEPNRVEQLAADLKETTNGIQEKKKTENKDNGPAHKKIDEEHKDKQEIVNKKATSIPTAEKQIPDKLKPEEKPLIGEKQTPSFATQSPPVRKHHVTGVQTMPMIARELSGSASPSAPNARSFDEVTGLSSSPPVSPMEIPPTPSPPTENSPNTPPQRRIGLQRSSHISPVDEPKGDNPTRRPPTFPPRTSGAPVRSRMGPIRAPTNGGLPSKPSTLFKGPQVAAGPLSRAQMYKPPATTDARINQGQTNT